MSTQCFLNIRPPQVSFLFLHDSRTILHWIWLTEQEWFLFSLSPGLKNLTAASFKYLRSWKPQYNSSKSWIMEKTKYYACTGRTQASVVVREDGVQAERKYNHLAFKLLDTSRLEGRIWKTKVRICDSAWKEYCRVKKKPTTTVYLSCNQACRLVISADILLDSCWAFVVCHLLSVSYLFCTALQWSTQWSRQALKTARKFKWPSILLWNNIWWSLTGNVCMKPPVMIWCCHLPGLAAGTDGGGGGATAAQMVQMWTAKPPEWIPV